MLGITLGKVAAFVVAMLLIGRRVIPWLLHYVAHTGSRELFRLAVLAIALGVAFGAAELFGVSFALGAFFAGMILSESELSHRAAEETLPLRDAFAVLFFVSVGMLFDPSVLLAQPLQLAATVAVIVVGKSIAAYLIVRAFGHSNATALTVSASLAQIGEFSFILASLGVALGLLPEAGQALILAGAILSILVNPLAFLLADRLSGEKPAEKAVETAPPEIDLVDSAQTAHAVVVGYGRVGQVLAQGLRDRGEKLLVIEERPALAAQARAAGIETIEANAAAPAVAKAAGVAAARRLFVAIPNGFEAGQIVEQARAANAAIEIVGRAHSDDEVAHLESKGANRIVMGEREIALAMLAAAPG
jgi:CPA2 family monovalent cation:H+ antiporter-2